MKRLSSSIFGVWLPLAAVPAFALLLSFSLIRMLDVESDMRVDAEQNMLWVLHQAEVAALRLTSTIALAEAGAASTDDVALRFDILQSRISLLHAGPQHRFIEQIHFTDTLDQLSRTLDSLAPEIGAFTPNAGPGLRSRLAPFARRLGQAANVAMITEWDDLGGRLEAQRTQLHQAMASLAGIMVAGAVLTVTLVQALRQSHRRNRMLRRERDFSALLIASSGEGILAVDNDGRCTLWNPAMVDIIGKSESQATGETLANIANFFTTPAVHQGVARALAGSASRLTLQPLFPPGCATALYVDLHAFPMRDDGTILGAILLLHDASDRHAAQQKEALHRDQLEELVTERTRELNSALQRERSAAELYRNFAAMVSHQFRTPLAVADSALQRLVRRGKRAPAEEIAERAERARRAIAGLTRLVDSTLDAARLDAGQIGARRQRCSVAAIVETVCERQRETTPERQIVLEHAIATSATAFCDPAHVEQILENLLSNAAKYAPHKAPITVRIHADSARLICDVHHDGAPIAFQDRERVFERNYRGVNSAGIAGTGIGLFMAQTLARMQGGELHLQPADQGVTFRLTLPRYAGAMT
ncbi:sensor histidine kinase [Halomonas piscis]|uniref:sensor histidine kinase n=1 Tax=Halomonas piscis TaxID=3031727 RepID=UPI00289F4C37|nr:ATP-binding protein [Halomonas piscis]